METVTTRRSGIELLRILAMLMIVGHHFAVHSGFRFQPGAVTGNMLFLQWLNIGGKLGVDLFVLISGHFLVTRDRLRIQKAVRLWLQIFFYSLGILLAVTITGAEPLTGSRLLDALSPVLSRQWWFASTYFLMYLLHPAVNRLLRGLSKKRQLLLLAVLACFWYPLPLFTLLPEWARDLAWFLFLYCLCSCLRRWGIPDRHRPGTWLALGTGLLLLSFGWAVILLRLLSRGQASFETVYFQTWDPLLLLSGVCLFLGFLGLELRPSPRINSLAAAVFGIYLIHDSNDVRYRLWKTLLGCARYSGSPLLIPYAIAVIAGVFFVCLALEKLRSRLLDRPFARISESVETGLKRLQKP